MNPSTRAAIVETKEVDSQPSQLLERRAGLADRLRSLLGPLTLLDSDR